MEQEYLMRFLEVGSFSLNSDDTKLEKLRTTAKDLSAALRTAPFKTVTQSSLVGFDIKVDAVLAAL